MNNSWCESFVRCPECGGRVILGSTASCSSCEFQGITGNDLRPKNLRTVRLDLPTIQRIFPEVALNSIDTSCPEITYIGPSAIRNSRILMSEVKARIPQGGAVLDLGCGPRDQYAPLSFLGFQYVGVDFCHSAADFLADAHAIPFANDTFDCVFSYAVLEHLHNPFIAIHEILRVLKPGGWFIGTVSQGEPFHSSYFHHTAWGLLSIVGTASDLMVHRIWESSDTLQSLATMGRYSRVLKGALAGLNAVNTWLPWLTPRKMTWPAKDKQLDRIHRAGSICFSIEKVNRSAKD
jgi:SAM-dependent methyltransferase